MRLPCFTFASFMARVSINDPVFNEVGVKFCNTFIDSLPPSHATTEFHEFMSTPNIGKYALQRHNTLFIIDIEENENSVILHRILSDEKNQDFMEFVNDYNALKKKVFDEGGVLFFCW